MRDLVKLDKEHHYLYRQTMFISKGYAFVYINGKSVAVHRIVAGKKSGYEVDHINRDKLDNRRSNLRHVTHQENLRNRNGWGALPKGVYFDKSSKRAKPYKAMRRVNGKSVSYGYYATPEEAAIACNSD